MPLLNFICYEPERFDDAFAIMASAFDFDFAHLSAKEPEFVQTMKESLDEMLQKETYVFFYKRVLADFVFAFVESPRKAITQLEEKLPGTAEKLKWTIDFEWPVSSSPLIEVHYADKERRFYRAVLDVVTLMADQLRSVQSFMINEIELLFNFRTVMGAPKKSSLEYLFMMEMFRKEQVGYICYLEHTFHTFYGAIPHDEVVQLYEIDSIQDLLCFEFIKMIEHDIFIKKCKNCERFFIPERRADAEYCERTFGDAGRKCSEIGAMLRYEKKVAENPVLDAHKKAYRRFNSRVRAKKMTRNEFRLWSDEAARKRDTCLAGDLAFEEFVVWLEQGRVRRKRGEGTREDAE